MRSSDKSEGLIVKACTRVIPYANEPVGLECDASPSPGKKKVGFLVVAKKGTLSALLFFCGKNNVMYFVSLFDVRK